jgi:phytol kinase
MTRTGSPKEILHGPLFYGIVFVILTVLYWKDSPIGITALMMMCGGDGIADIVGRRVKSPKLYWSPEKSVAGSLSVFVGGAALTVLILFIYVSMGIFAAPFAMYLLPIALIALGAMLVESLPFKDIDNITLTVVSALLGHLVF